MLKLEGAWQAAVRICSRTSSGISTGSKTFTALLWKTDIKTSSVRCVMLSLQHVVVADATRRKTSVDSSTLPLGACRTLARPLPHGRGSCQAIDYRSAPRTESVSDRPIRGLEA